MATKSTPSSRLNAICPYFTMFPIDFPLSALDTHTATRVLDPFCGRGTTSSQPGSKASQALVSDQILLQYHWLLLRMSKPRSREWSALLAEF